MGELFCFINILDIGKVSRSQAHKWKKEVGHYYTQVHIVLGFMMVFRDVVVSKKKNPR